MTIVWNENTKATGSHLKLDLSLFLGEDENGRKAKAELILNKLRDFALNVLRCEVTGEAKQADSRVSAYDAYRAAGVDHEQAILMIEADKKRAELLAAGRAALKKTA